LKFLFAGPVEAAKGPIGVGEQALEVPCQLERRLGGQGCRLEGPVAGRMGDGPAGSGRGL